MFCQKCGAELSPGIDFCPSCGNLIASPAASATIANRGATAVPAAVIPGMDYATWANRAIGYIVDFLMVLALMCVLYAVLGGMFGALAGIGGERMASPVCCFSVILFPLSTLLVGLYNKVYLIAQRGYSIGQGMVKIKVVDARGDLLTQGTALVRLLVQAAFGLIPFLPLLDMLWPLWDLRRQTLHDKAVNCYVINNASAV